MSFLLFVRLLHFILFLYIVCVPFLPLNTSTEWLFQIYFYLAPFLLIHWFLEDDTCALTELESYLSGVPKTETFVGRILSPIFLISDKSITIFTILLYIIVLYKIKNPIKLIERDLHIMKQLFVNLL
jgi:hypothetical protein